ncbi:MAG: hypothetical protein FJX30_04505 [Alphaproteobacteria bacterium]|nr:hypothetical protein [Alphaproteobacteria bacterium]
MTQDNQEFYSKNIDPETHKSKNRNHFLLKFFLIILSVFIIFFLYKNLQINSPVNPKTPLSKYNETLRESDLLDISDEYKDNNETTLHDLNISEIKEKGAEFVYQLLIKNQVQIEDLQNQLRYLKTDLIKFKNQEKFNKFVLNYIELREKLFNGSDCKTEIENYDLLIINDEFLQKKFSTIKENYKELPSHQKLIDDFKLIIRELIINENYSEDSADFIEKLSHNLKKVIIIRKISPQNPLDLQGKIVEIENAIKQKDYDLALTKLLSLDKMYFPIIQKYLEELGIATEIINADKEIVKYLKSLT